MATKTTKSKIKIKDLVQVKDVVNVKKQYLIKSGYIDFMDWASHDNHVYIGRDMSFYVPGANASIWQNPFPLLVPGKKYKDKKIRYTLDESLILYEKHILSNPDLMARLHELNGKTLGCWCILTKSDIDTQPKCHGDVLVKLVREHCNNK